MAALGAAVLIVDQVTKAVVVGSIELGERVQVLPFLDLVYVRNEGVAFGFLGGASQLAVIVVTAIAIGLVGVWFAVGTSRPSITVAVGMLAGGAVGNLIDRLARDGVVDFIDVASWPSFNVADIAITAGALLLVWTALREPAAK